MDNEKATEIAEGIKAVTTSVVCSLVLAAAFALVLQITRAADKLISPVNLAIKTISLFVGCAFTLRGRAGWLRGMLVGLAYTCVSGVLFGLVGGAQVSWLVLLDVAFGAIVGALSGIFAVNFRG